MRSPKSRVLTSTEKTTTNVSKMVRSKIIPLSHIPSCILTDTLLYTCDIIQMEYKENEFGVTEHYVNKPGIKSVNYIYISPTNDSMETQNQAEAKMIPEQNKTVQILGGNDATVVQYPTEKVESIAEKVEYPSEKIENTNYRETQTTKLDREKFWSPRRYRIVAELIVMMVVCYSLYANT